MQGSSEDGRRSVLILAPLFALGSSVVSPAFKSDEGAQLDVIAQHPTRSYWFTILLLVGSILFVPALLGIDPSSANALGVLAISAVGWRCSGR